MKKFIFVFIALAIITGCSSTKLTPEEREDMQRHAERIHGMRN
jgi:uncharacterized protein YcfL